MRSTLPDRLPTLNIRCRHCKDRIFGFVCRFCNDLIVDQCKECHMEIAHGVISDNQRKEIYYIPLRRPEIPLDFDKVVKFIEDNQPHMA